MGICSHSVAAAEISNKLHEFIEWYKRSKKTPNLSKFAEATMPKGRGNKGGACSRKRKVSVPVEHIFENPSFSRSVSQTNISLQSSNPVQIAIPQDQVSCTSVQPTWPPADVITFSTVVYQFFSCTPVSFSSISFSAKSIHLV